MYRTNAEKVALSPKTAADQKSVDVLLHEACLKYAGETAASDQENSITYEELDYASSAVAGLLQKRYGNAGDYPVRVCVLFSGRVERLVCIAGILKAGMTYIPLDPEAPADRNAFICGDAKVACILTEGNYLDVARIMLSRCGKPEEDAIAKSMEEWLAMERTYRRMQMDPEDDVYIIYTSGSTGTPKGVRIPGRALSNFLSGAQEMLHITEQDKVGSMLSAAFDFSIMELYLPFLHGAEVVLVPDALRRDVEGMNRYLVEKGVTLIALPTSIYDLFVDMENDVLRAVVAGGETFTKYRKKKYSIYNIYGPTEATVWITQTPITSQKDISIGSPIPNVEVLILRKDGTLADPGERGEICVQGPCVANGYLNNEEQTAARFVPSVLDPSVLMYRTGDIGSWRTDGKLNFYGREDFAVKYRGYRIELDEINWHLSRMEGIRESRVIFMDQGLSKYIAAFCAVENGTVWDTNRLSRALAGFLPEYMIPARWILLDEIPKNQNGKTDRNALKQLLAREATGAWESEQDPEKYLRGMWSELLAIDGDFDEHAPFITLGGHSILCMTMLAKTNRKYRTGVKLSEFMEEPTLSHLVELLEKRSDEVTEQPELKDFLAQDTEAADSPFPLSDIQRSYYFGRSSNVLGGVPTCLYLECRAVDVNIARLEAAIRRLIMRHDALRTVVLDGQWQQVVSNPPSFHLEVDDLGSLSEEECEIKRNEIFGWLSCQMPDLTQYPTFLLKAVKARQEYFFYAALDSTFVDGASLAVLMRDLSRLYKGEALTAAPVTFRNYSRYLCSLEESAEYREGLEYWRRRAHSLPAAPAIPVKNKNGNPCGKGSVRRIHRISKEKWEHIKALSMKENVSLFAVQATMYAIVMSVWSNADDFTLNIPIFNRRLCDESIPDMVGEFGSLILLEVHLEQEKGFLYNCRKIQRQFELDMDHRLVNGTRVLRELQKMGANSAFPVVFTSLTEPDGTGGIYHSGIELCRWKSQSSQVWIDYLVFDRDGGVELVWDCYDGVFDEAVLDDMFQANVRGYELLETDEEFCRKRILGKVYGSNYQRVLSLNDTHFDYGADTELLQDGFLRSLAATPKADALLFSGCSFSYEEVFRRAAALAQVIKEHGVTNGNVGFFFPKGPEQVIAALAVLLSGNAYVPISVSWPAERRNKIFRQAEISLLLTDHEEEAIPDDVTQIIAEEIDLSAADRFRYSRTASASDTAYILYTSGSTGDPKGVVIEHRGVVNTLYTVNRMNAIDAQDRTILLSEMHFDVSIYDIFGIFLAGGAVYALDGNEKNRPQNWLDILEEKRITVWSTVPALMQMMLDISEEDTRVYRGLKHVFLSGDWIPVNLPERIWKRFPDAKLLSMGGATEASIWSNYYYVDQVDPSWTSIPYGFPMDNQKMMVLDRHGYICPESVPGDIYIGGISLAREYLKDGEKTAEKFRHHERLGERLYLSGDLGMYRSDGAVEFLGRSDFQIKLNGFRIELGEIESGAMKHPSITFAVAVFRREKGRIDLYYKGSEILKPGTVRDFLAEIIPDYMIPQGYLQIQEIPVNANGKVDRKQLPEIVEDNREEDSAACTDLENKVLSAYRSVLSDQKIGMRDNFFVSGGDSLKAVRLLASLNRELKPDFSLAEIFLYPTPFAMAEAISRKLITTGGTL